MTPRLRVTGKEVISALRRAWFEVTRTRGSHRFLRHPDGRVTTVPVHAGENIGPGLMSKVLRDTKLSRAEFEELLTG
jgi:predicted RNA binding protein YcfA (HicA-like mRNA interferase family)